MQQIVFNYSKCNLYTESHKIETCFINNLESLKTKDQMYISPVGPKYFYHEKNIANLSTAYNFLIDLVVPNKKWLVRVNRNKINLFIY